MHVPTIEEAAAQEYDIERGIDNIAAVAMKGVDLAIMVMHFYGRSGTGAPLHKAALELLALSGKKE